MKLNKNYRIVYEENNTILQFFEQRKKVKKDKSEEQYEYVDNYYYPHLKSALKAYLNKVVSDTTIEGVVSKIENVEKLILNLK